MAIDDYAQIEHDFAMQRQERARFKADLRKHLSHELSELAICLDQPANVEMAVSRLGNITRYLKRVGVLE